MDEQSRINATISYFFLGPLFLIAKKGTPLSSPFVRGHALRSSLIISLAGVAYAVYIFFLKSWLTFSIMGFQAQNIVLSILSTVMILLLLRGAYRAYHGLSEDSNEQLLHTDFQTNTTSHAIETEEEKVRVVASMIPLLGIYIAERYPHPLTTRGRIIGSTLFFVILLSNIFSSEWGMIITLVGWIAVLLFVVLAVNIFLRSSFIGTAWIEKIPSYREWEAHFFALILSIREFIRIAFGGSGKRNYHELYIEELEQTSEKVPPSNPYFMPAGLIGVPFWNLFTLPSLWIEQYREYRRSIIAWLLITLITWVLIYFRWSSSNYLPFLLFPIVHMLVMTGSDLGSAIPGINILFRIFGFAGRTHAAYQEKKNQTEEVHYSYSQEEK